MSRWTEETGISKRIRERIVERDNGRCVLCWSGYGVQIAHVVPRSRGGRGIETNLVLLCAICHDRYDHTVRRPEMREQIVEYLTDIYGEWEERDQIYHKY